MQNAEVTDMTEQNFALSEVTLRATGLEDVQALTELLNLPGVRYGTLRQPFQTVEKIRKSVENRSPADLVIAAIWHARLIATGGLYRRAGRQLHVADLVITVHDDFTRKGLGAHILAALIDAADNWHDIRRIELNVFTDNLAAISLYEKFGFEREGTLRNDAYRDGKYVDAYVMARLR